MTSVGVSGGSRMVTEAGGRKGSEPPTYDEVIRAQVPVSIQLEPDNTDNPGQHQNHHSSQPCCRWKKRDTKVCKKIGLVYAAVGLFVTVPLCVTMAVFGQSDGAHATVPEKTIPLYLYETTSISTYKQSRQRCTAQPSLPSYMVISAVGGFTISLLVTVFHLVGDANREDCCDEAGEKALKILTMIGVCILLIFYILGSMSTYQMWLQKKCDPFSSEGCPYSYCDNRLMQFVYIFYPATMILLAPFWIICMYFAVMFVKNIVNKESSVSD